MARKQTTTTGRDYWVFAIRPMLIVAAAIATALYVHPVLALPAAMITLTLTWAIWNRDVRAEMTRNLRARLDRRAERIERADIAAEALRLTMPVSRTVTPAADDNPYLLAA